MMSVSFIIMSMSIYHYSPSPLTNINVQCDLIACEKVCTRRYMRHLLILGSNMKCDPTLDICQALPIQPHSRAPFASSLLPCTPARSTVISTALLAHQVPCTPLLCMSLR